MSQEKLHSRYESQSGFINFLFPTTVPRTPLYWAATPRVESKPTCIGLERLEIWNTMVESWSKENGIAVTQVSGLIAKRHNARGELEILINQGRDSETGKEKPWQPFGGKVGVGPGSDPNETPLEALIRECRDEAGREIDPATISYWKSYVQKPKPGTSSTYNIHAFVMENCDWDINNLTLKTDARQVEWVNNKTAFVMPDGTPRPMTPQTRHILLSLGFTDPFGAQEDDDYDGRPDVARP